MGLPRALIKLIAESVRDFKLGGRVLIIGKQDVWGTGKEVIQWLRESGLDPANCEAGISPKPDFARLGFIQDTSLFKLMGFGEAIVLDNSPYEGAEIIHDLNLALPSKLLGSLGRFDLIVDSGCLEHIFDVPQVLRNYFQLATEQGVVIHIAPSANFVDHGFYMFSPTLFHDFYTANRWRILRQYFYRNRHSHTASFRIYEYEPAALFPLSFGGLNGGMYGTYIAAQKQPGATCDAEVQQGMYLKAWSQEGGQTARDNQSRKNGWPALRERLKPHVPKMLIPALITLELKLRTAGGVPRYLRHYKNL